MRILDTLKLAVLIDPYGPAIDQACFLAVLLHAGDLLLELLRKPNVIGIQRSDVFPAGHTDRRIPGGAHSCVALPNELNSGILFYEFLDNGTRAILGTIINYNDFQRLIRLRKDRIQRLPNVFRGIVELE